MPFEIDVREKVAELVFNHPPVNAFSGQMWMELPGLITELGQRPEVRCVLVRADEDLRRAFGSTSAYVAVSQTDPLERYAFFDFETEPSASVTVPGMSQTTVAMLSVVSVRPVTVVLKTNVPSARPRYNSTFFCHWQPRAMSTCSASS